MCGMAIVDPSGDRAGCRWRRCTRRAISEPRLYGLALDRDAVLRELAGNWYFLIERPDAVVATGAYRLREDGSAYVSNIAVHPEHRRAGLARRMLAHLLGSLGAVPSVDLAVHPNNVPARTLYASLGFAATVVHGNFLGDGEPRLIMVRHGAAGVTDRNRGVRAISRS